tara:strand:- start:98 stop:301 length:204 start_codon:yes stop_codon:yes gene_type:complete
MNLRPELVEKNEPPMITKIKKIKVKFFFSVSFEKPILDILLEIERRLLENSLLKLKKRKKILTVIKK